MQRSPAAALVLVLALRHGARAQTAGAQCSPGFDWTFNTRGQSPCTVAAYLDSACQAVPSQTYIEPLNPDSHYTLDTSNANDCFCNTVFYSVISACALCQEGEYVSWSTWNTNCSSTFTDEFPKPIPSDSAVPAWAYLPLTTGAWNSTTAEEFKAQDNTDITAQGSASLSSIPPTSTSSNSVVSPTPVTTTAGAANVSPAKKKTDVGAIVGGVVGGVAGLAFAVLALLFWLRHRKAQRRPPSAAFQKAEPLTISPYTPEPAEKDFSPHTLTSPYSASSLGRLYNADDASTLPEGYAGHSVYSQSQRGSAIFSAQNGYQPAGIRYMGVPEV